jgi:hypothetical protein
MRKSVLAVSFLMIPALAQVNVLTWHNDPQRTGQNLKETILTPANVKSSAFGNLFTIPTDGKVDAQPLYVSALKVHGVSHNVVFIATENDSLYAADADSGAILWRKSMLLAGETASDDHGCNQVTPTIGITSTPVIDLARGPHGTMYLVALSKDGAGKYYQRLHALDITTGAEQLGGPVEVEAKYPGVGDNSSNGVVTFDPAFYTERAALLLLDGTVYTAWSSHCDRRPYTGWIIGYSEGSLKQVSVLNVTPNGSQGSIWGAGAGPAAAPGGNIFFLTANGEFDSTLDAQGFPSKEDYGNCFMKISPGGGQQLTVLDYFTMSNTSGESDSDEDLGSGGTMVLPDLRDAQNKLHLLAVGAGKDRTIYVADRGNMGKFDPNKNKIYQQIPGVLTGGVFSSPAYFNGVVYYGSVADVIRAFPIKNARLTVNPVTTSHSFPYPGATPSISANGTANGIVWAASNGSSGSMWAFDASNLSTELYSTGNLHLGPGNKFVVPTIANGKVYLGLTNGVAVFGLK